MSLAEDFNILNDRAKEDPAWWVATTLGIKLWQKQVEIIESVRDNYRTFVRSCHGAGKTFTAADVALWFLLNHPNSKVITTAPTFRQVQKVLWQEIRKAHKGAKIRLGGSLTLTELKITDGWFSFGFSTDDPDSLQGQHAEYILVIFDEASGIHSDIWEAIDSLLTSQHARFLAIGNPTDPLGDFAEGFKDATINKIAISAFDTPNFTEFGITQEDCENGNWENKIGSKPLPYPDLVTPFWVADAFRKYGVDSPWCQARVFGNFPDDAEDVLIPLSWIEAAVRRELKPVGTDTKELGVDVSTRGKDETVIYIRHGPVARLLDARFPPPGGKISTVETAKRIQKYMEKEEATFAKVDGIGVGTGVVDKLGELEVLHEDVQFGESAKDNERFLNLRAESYWGLRERFDPDNGDIDIEHDEVLMAQLASIKWDTNPAGKIRLEAKDKLPKSPDRADALAILFSGGAAEAWSEGQYLMGDEMVSARGR
jgi:hypothetical protein|tara:strand:+ start:4491 stop:5942 length:1452 start_codon:yes stop_codon:yes gene_type:complete